MPDTDPFDTFRAYAYGWASTLGERNPEIRKGKLKNRACESTTDGYGPILTCDPSKLKGRKDLREIALHEIVHVKRRDYEKPGGDEAQHGPEFEADFRRYREDAARKAGQSKAMRDK